MRASRDLRITQAFVLTKEELRKIFEAIGPAFDAPSLSAKCADGIERNFSDLAELDAYENAPKKAIRSLGIRAHSVNLRGSCAMRFEDSAERNIFLFIEADEEHVIKIAEMLEERLSSMRPWYHLIAKSSAFWLVMIPYWFFSVITPFVRTWSSGKPLLPTTFNVPAYVYLIAAAVVLGIFVIIALVGRFKRILFPMGVFAIGQGEKRHRDQDIYRTTLVIAFVVGVAASLLATWLT